METPLVRHLDSTWPMPAAAASPAPLVLEPGLASLVWPLSPAEFMCGVYGRKALVVGGTGERLGELRRELEGLDLPTLLAGATKIVIWMKSREGKMQYLEGSAAVALSCYAAGHSLYFNPALDIQKRWVEALALEMGLELEGSVMPGDLEVFAVAGRHDTPWHLDAQENLTVQLRGVKRWSVAASPLRDPVTNFHPSSSNVPAVLADRGVHRSYCDAVLTPPAAEGGGVDTFYLRPGSVLYAPAGLWHRVECPDDEGSLSINLSIDGRRWADVVLDALRPVLWRDPRWRGRALVGSVEGARAELGAMLKDLPALLAALTPQHFLPEGALTSLRPRGPVVVDRGQTPEVALSWLEGHRLESSTVLTRNSMAVLLSTADDGPTPSQPPKRQRLVVLHGGFRDEDKEPVLKVEVAVSGRLRDVVARLEVLPPGAPVAMKELRALVGGTEGGNEEGASDVSLLHHFVAVLAHFGYLVVHESMQSQVS
jgi:hypothetical protein